MAFWNRRSEQKPEPEPQTRVASSSTLVGDDVRRLLEGCCMRTASAIILCSDVGATYNGRFHELVGDTITVNIASSHPPAIKLLSMCVITFNQGTRARVFLSSVVGAETVGDRHSLVIQVPNEMVGAEGRFAFRVPVLDPHLATVEFERGGVSTPAEAVDVSLTGIQVELPEDDLFAIDEEVSVHMRVGAVTQSMRGIVRRCSGRRCGVFFPETVHEGGRVEAPEALVTIVRDLERIWLQERQD